ncbi:MAG: FmdB family zinc ribbon protein [Candidatus Binataceae bacterium]
MPLYEWECLACETTFEDLVPVSEGSVGHACPSCGRMSPRVVSTFAIASGAGPQPAAGTATAAPAAKPPPICLRYPHIPLLCHMDQPTAERAVAYAHGRGGEYDDKKGAREELRKKRGLPPPPPPAPPMHAHTHNPRRHQAAGAGQPGKAAAGHDHATKDAHKHDHAGGSDQHSKGPKAGQSGASAHSH